MKFVQQARCPRVESYARIELVVEALLICLSSSPNLLSVQCFTLCGEDGSQFICVLRLLITMNMCSACIEKKCKRSEVFIMESSTIVHFTKEWNWCLPCSSVSLSIFPAFGPVYLVVWTCCMAYTIPCPHCPSFCRTHDSQCTCCQCTLPCGCKLFLNELLASDTSSLIWCFWFHTSIPYNIIA